MNFICVDLIKKKYRYLVLKYGVQWQMVSSCPHKGKQPQKSVLNPFLDVARCIRHETFILWCHFLWNSAERGGGWVHPTGADSMAVSRLHFRNAWLALVGPLLSSFAWTGLENSPLTLHIPHFRWGSLYPSLGRWLPAECCDYCKLNNGWVWFEWWTCRGWL